MRREIEQNREWLKFTPTDNPNREQFIEFIDQCTDDQILLLYSLHTSLVQEYEEKFVQLVLEMKKHLI